VTNLVDKIADFSALHAVRIVDNVGHFQIAALPRDLHDAIAKISQCRFRVQKLTCQERAAQSSWL